MVVDSVPLIVRSAFDRRLPPKVDYGIAFIGCGGIVNYGHIPAYRTSGFNMIGGYDINHEAAVRTVQTHGLNKVYASLDELLLDPSIQIVDIAVLPWEQREIVEKSISAGKHVLCQKPFSSRYAEAVEMTALAQRAA